MKSKSNINKGQFEKDYDEIFQRLESVLRDSKVIKKVIEEKSEKDDPEQIMALLRELMPRAIKGLGQIYRFLNKYGYNNVENI